MAYSSSVAAPCLLTPGSFGGQALRLWGYKSTADTVAGICASSFFSDGYKRGMRPGDFVLVRAATSSTSFAVGMVLSVTTASSLGGASITVAATSS